MSNKERVALDAMARVKRKELTVVEAAGLMGLSLRQARRVSQRFGGLRRLLALSPKYGKSLTAAGLRRRPVVI